jgi:hypothetical protein
MPGRKGPWPCTCLRCSLSSLSPLRLWLGSGGTRHPGSDRLPPSGRRAGALPPSRRIGAPRVPARAQRRQNGCPLLPIHTRVGVRLRDTLHGHFSRPSPDPIPGDIGRASRRALTRRTAALWLSSAGPPISELALCPAQAPDPTPPNPHHRVAVEARLRPGGGPVHRPVERGRVRRRIG